MSVVYLFVFCVVCNVLVRNLFQYCSEVVPKSEKDQIGVPSVVSCAGWMQLQSADTLEIIECGGFTYLKAAALKSQRNTLTRTVPKLSQLSCDFSWFRKQPIRSDLSCQCTSVVVCALAGHKRRIYLKLISVLQSLVGKNERVR